MISGVFLLRASPARLRVLAKLAEAARFGDRDETLRAGNALEAVESAVGQTQAGASDQVPHRRRGENLAGPGRRRDSRGDVDGDPSEAVADDLAFPRVHARSRGDPERSHGVADRTGRA
jgi:hypothetical protein